MRTHAAIVCLADQYALYDLSLKGIFIDFDKGEDALLRKNKIALQGAGAIALLRDLDFKRNGLFSKAGINT